MRLNPPKTKAELLQQVVADMEYKGVDYYLREYSSPEYSGAEMFDPELAKMWHEYLNLIERIKTHVGLL